MKYYIISGEASGDLHGSHLVHALKQKDADAHIRGWGGDKMALAGVHIVKHYRDLAFMGFAEVIANLPTILKNLSFCKKDIEAFQPDVLVLIDYPGFNLRIAKWASGKGIKVVYYIAPQVWAWKENRVKAMKQYIDKLLVILPFEETYFKQKWDWEVSYVGHPLVEEIAQFKQANASLTKGHTPIIALLPGSRKQEISVKLPIMLSVCQYFPDYQFVVAMAPGLETSFYQSFLEQYPNVASVSNDTYSLFMRSCAALVTSGTATLEAALFGVPEVVCYKGSNISYAIAKRLIKVKYISLVNLIMDKLVVQECIQHDLNTENLVAALKDLLYNTQKKQVLQQQYHALWQKLYADGNASEKAAREIYAMACLQSQ